MNETTALDFKWKDWNDATKNKVKQLAFSHTKTVEISTQTVESRDKIDVREESFTIQDACDLSKRLLYWKKLLTLAEESFLSELVNQDGATSALRQTILSECIEKYRFRIQLGQCRLRKRLKLLQSKDEKLDFCKNTLRLVATD